MLLFFQEGFVIANDSEDGCRNDLSFHFWFVSCFGDNNSYREAKGHSELRVLVTNAVSVQNWRAQVRMTDEITAHIIIIPIPRVKFWIHFYRMVSSVLQYVQNPTRPSMFVGRKLKMYPHVSALRTFHAISAKPTRHSRTLQESTSTTLVFPSLTIF